MMTGLQKYSKEPTRQKSSSPKFQVFNTALTTHKSSFSFATIMQDKDRWGRLVESAVGAHLINQTQNTGIQVSYWREGNKEVDFVLHDGKDVIALEVKSGKARESFIGMDAFAKRFSPKRILIVGADGISIEEFLSRDPSWWF
jgi:predicted AAA+ superfamily ATPase